MEISLNVTTVAHEDQNFKIIPRINTFVEEEEEEVYKPRHRSDEVEAILN